MFTNDSLQANDTQVESTNFTSCALPTLAGKVKILIGPYFQQPIRTRTFRSQVHCTLESTLSGNSVNGITFSLSRREKI